VVDDKWENRQLLVEWLRAVGFQVREAGDGAEAIQVWEEWSPHMIWMDVRMPVLDGYEATRRIKATLKGQATVVIALTASAFEHEQVGILSAGCDDFVRKPVREALIFKKIAEHLGLRFVYEAASQAVPAAESTPPATLAGLPAELVGQLRQAVLEADLEQVRLLIDQIRPRDQALAGQLARMVDNFRIDQLHALVQSG
jgi:CheY-like chemotaxis protein